MPLHHRCLPLAILIVVAAACGGALDQPTDAGGPGVEYSCDNGVEPIVELLETGMPTYDYQPMVDLGEMIDVADVILTGTLESARRTEIDFGDGAGPTGWTEVTPGEVEDLKPPGLQGEPSFGWLGGWADRASEDPLGEPVGLDPTRLRFIAFLHDDGQRLAPFVQGLLIGCGPGGVAAPVGDPIPGLDGLTVDEIEAEVRAVTQPAPPEAEVASIPHRVLVEDLSYGRAWTTRILRAEEVWEVAPVAELDPDNEVFFEFNVPESGNCRFGPMTDLAHNPVTGRVYPVVEPVALDGGCQDDDNPHVVLVAVARQDLPDADFSLWVNGDIDMPDVGDAATFVERGELRPPDGGDLEYPVLAGDGGLEVGETAVILDASTHCGLERLYDEIDGRQWLMAEPGPVPPSWQDVTRGESIDLVVERPAADQLTVTARLTEDSVSYVPAPDLEGCD